MRIEIDDLSHPKVAVLLQQHLDDMYATSPAESVHALDIEKLRQTNITFWTVWQEQELLGCSALKTLSDQHAEIKSMRTARKHLRKGVAAKMLEHIILQAKAKKLKRISLETGSQTFFQPAIALYKRYGFEFCGPFANYQPDPNSLFLTLKLADTVQVDSLSSQNITTNK